MKKYVLFVLAAVIAVLACSAAAFAELSIEGEFPSGKVGIPYPSSPVVLNGHSYAVLYKWELIKGKLPDGLGTEDAGQGVLIHSNKHAIKLTGRPKKAGVYHFSFMVYDVENPSDFADKDFSVIIEDNPDLPTPELEGTFPVSGTVGKPYTGTIEAKGGTPAYKWEYDDKLLPSGLGIKLLVNSTRCELSGIPNKVGEYKFTIKAEDDYGKSVVREFTIVIDDGKNPNPKPDDQKNDDQKTDDQKTDPNDPTTPNTNTVKSVGGGGGGCNASIGLIALLAIAIAFRRSR